MQTIELPDSSDSVFWAVVGYSRWWLSTDAPFVQKIAHAEGRLEVETASKIMTNYNVARWFKEKQSREFHKAIATVNCRVADWPTDLSGRYAFCDELAKKWRHIEATRNLQISAATKVMWFLRPKG